MPVEDWKVDDDAFALCAPRMAGRDDREVMERQQRRLDEEKLVYCEF